MFSEALTESVPLFQPDPALLLLPKDKLRHLVCTADGWAGHWLSTAPPITQLHNHARQWGKRKSRKIAPKKGHLSNYLLSKIIIIKNNNSGCAALGPRPTITSPHRPIHCTPLRSHQSLTVFCNPGVILRWSCGNFLSFFFFFLWISLFPQPISSAFALEDEFPHTPQPQENRCELVVFSFVFHVQVMSNSRSSSDTDSMRTQLLHPRKGRIISFYW